MLEKRMMGYFSREYPSNRATSVTVLFDTETNKVELFNYDDGEWDAPNGNERFYPTVEDADAALDEYKRGLIAKMKDVKEYLDVMANFHPDDDEESPFHFSDSDYLPYCKTDEGIDSGYFRKRARKLDQLNTYIKSVVRTGFLNIMGNSFKVEDVAQVKWGGEKAELILRNGSKVETCNDAEFDIVRYLFGANPSEYTYNYLKNVEKGDD